MVAFKVKATREDNNSVMIMDVLDPGMFADSGNLSRKIIIKRLLRQQTYKNSLERKRRRTRPGVRNAQCSTGEQMRTSRIKWHHSREESGRSQNTQTIRKQIKEINLILTNGAWAPIRLQREKCWNERDRNILLLYR